MATNGGSQADFIRDADRDALHILPLAVVPMKTPVLRRARMIKNARLEAAIELFSGAEMGSGQLSVEDAIKEFEWPTVPPHPDLILLRKLALLPSYDVYSLRILLRDHGIVINDLDAFRLSPTKVHELTSYMTEFTRPLMVQIYGDEDRSIRDFDDIVALFRDPDVKRAREKLQNMADRLGIELIEIPKFLEDYGDIFLSLSYFRNCLDKISPVIDAFLLSLRDIRSNYQLKQDNHLMRTCDMIERSINDMMASITGRFENFDRSTNDLWNNLTADRFRKVERAIKSYHTTIGGVLCALSVKVDAWAALFPDKNIGGPVKRGEFIRTEMKQGFEHIRRIEDNAPMLAALG